MKKHIYAIECRIKKGIWFWILSKILGTKCTVRFLYKGNKQTVGVLLPNRKYAVAKAQEAIFHYTFSKWYMKLIAYRGNYNDIK